MGDGRYAYVTMLTSETYLPGALVLGHSLRRTGTPHRIVVMVVEGALGEGALTALRGVFDEVVMAAGLQTRDGDGGNLALLGRPELRETQTKVRAFDPAVVGGCERIVFLDADVLVLRNVDELFGAVGGSVEFAAAPDVGWPDCFNSGVFVAAPGRHLYEQLLAHFDSHGSFDGGDQGLLNSFFSSWARGPAANPRTARIPFIYNVTPSTYYSYLPAFKHFAADIAVVHFIGEAKPWRWSRFQDGSIIPRGGVSSQMIGLIQEWWRVFDEFKVHDALREFNLDRNWALYQPPQHGGDSQGQSGLHGSGHSHPNASAYASIQAEFANYRANWNARESYGAASSSARSRSKSPVKAGKPHSQRSPIKKMVSPVDANAPAPRSTSPKKQQLPNAAPIVETADISALYGANSVLTRMETAGPPSTDFGSYRVGWDPRELRGREKLNQSTTSTTPPSRSSSTEDLIMSCDEDISPNDSHLMSPTAIGPIMQQVPPSLARSAEIEKSEQTVRLQSMNANPSQTSTSGSKAVASNPSEITAPVDVSKPETSTKLASVTDNAKAAPTLTSATNISPPRTIATDTFTITPEGTIKYHTKK